MRFWFFFFFVNSFLSSPVSTIFYFFLFFASHHHTPPFAPLPPTRKTGPPSVSASSATFRAKRLKRPWLLLSTLISRNGRQAGLAQSSAGAFSSPGPALPGSLPHLPPPVTGHTPTRPAPFSPKKLSLFCLSLSSSLVSTARIRYCRALLFFVLFFYISSCLEFFRALFNIQYSVH